MDPRMMQAMALQDTPQYLEDDPNAPIQVTNQEGYAEELSPEALVAEGMAFAGNYMASNGPTRPRHIGRAKTMSKAQLEEQKMNENQGYPSNLDEAAKVKELEGKVSNIEQGIQAILGHLSGQSSQASVPPTAKIGGNPVSLAANLTQTQALSGTVPQRNPNYTASSGLSEPESKPQPQRQVTLSDGRRISVPQTASRAMGLGPATDPSAVTTPTVDESEDSVDDGWGDVDIVQQLEAPEPTQPDPKIARTQQLVQEVVTFLQNNDIHRYWRRHLAQKVHRHLGYSGWSKALQTEFDKRFAGFLNDPQFVTTICRKVIDMEMGHALGAKWVAGFLVCTAGFTAFALCGLDG